MNKKYELIESDVSWLFRIKALKDFGYVKTGDIGGYVEGEHNLSHDGNCWICDNAGVCEHAKVHCDASIHGNVTICGDAEIGGSRSVYGCAVINTPCKDFATHTFSNARPITAILTERDIWLFNVGCQELITKNEFIGRIHNTTGGLELNPHRQKYLDLLNKLY